MTRGMALPLRQERLADRSRLDVLEERAASVHESPSQRLMLALELSDLSRDHWVKLLNESIGGTEVSERLAEARLRATRNSDR